MSKGRLRCQHSLGGEGSKIGQICQWIVVKNCRWRGVLFFFNKFEIFFSSEISHSKKSALLGNNFFDPLTKLSMIVT